MPQRLLAPTALFAVLVSQLAWVAPTNFWGHDEWVVQYLLSIGVIDIPYANRPLGLFWQLPIPVLQPHDFQAWTLLFALYAWGSALLLRALCRHLLPGRALLAFSVPALFLVWSPSDPFRLACVERNEYMSYTFGTLLSAWLLIESWARRSHSLLALAILSAFVTIRSYEATLPLMLVFPLGLAWVLEERSKDFARWAAAWLAFAGLGGVLVALPLVAPSGHSYQLRIGFDPNAGRVLGRLAKQYAFHFEPLLRPGLARSEIASPAVALAAVSFLLGAWLSRATAREAPQRRADLRNMLLGLFLAGAGYALFALNVETGAWRKEFLSGPWIALSLGCAASWAASYVRDLWRRPLQLALLATIVAIGTGRTLQMQAAWDRFSYHDLQLSLLRQLTSAVPDVRPGTLIVLLDSGDAWRSSFGFHTASRYLYGGRASGWVYGRATVMFPTVFTAAGVASMPWPEVQLAWREPATLHRFDEIVVVHHGADRRVQVAPSWPAELPPLPPGARYEPFARILREPGVYPSRAILRRSATRTSADTSTPTSETATPSPTVRAP